MFPLGVGVGLDAGEPVPTEGGYRAVALNLAARLCAIAAPGQVLASESVVHLAQRVEGLDYGPPRSRRLKGVEVPVRCIEILPVDPLPPLRAPPVYASRRGAGRSLWLLVGLGALLVAISVAGIVWKTTSGSGTSAHPDVPVRANSVAIISPAAGRIVRDIPVGQAPTAIAIGFGSAWVVDSGDNTVSRIDLKTGEVAHPVITLSGSSQHQPQADRYRKRRC